MTRQYAAGVFFAAALIGLGTGCASRSPSEPPPASTGATSTTLTVVQSGNEVNLGWVSEVGKVYDVMYTENLRGASQWNVLPQGSSIVGNGEYVQITDRVSNGQRRFYRLSIREPESSSRKSRRR